MTAKNIEDIDPAIADLTAIDRICKKMVSNTMHSKSHTKLIMPDAHTILKDLSPIKTKNLVKKIIDQMDQNNLLIGDEPEQVGPRFFSIKLSDKRGNYILYNEYT